MKSVDALRELGSQYHDRIIFFKEEFDKCLDAIEEEGRTRYGTEYTDELYQFARRVEEAANERADVTLFGVDYTPLPVDADGVPIHVGDVMDGYGKTIEVVELRYGRSGWVLISRDGNGYADTFAFTHYHAPTVEDVLFDALKHFGAVEERTPEVDEWLHEYAAKLRLAGEE